MAQSELPHITYADLCKMARTDFYVFCVLLKPSVYTKKRHFLYDFCHNLQDFYEGKLLNRDGRPYTKIMINMPPRHCKTLTVDMFCQWVLGHDPKTSTMRVCYNEMLSSRSAKTVRDGIQEVKATPNRIVYSDIFPGVKIKYGDSSYQMWSLEDSPFSFLATSPNATITGVGCKIGIIDDLIRDSNEAYNERILEEHWNFYNNTYTSRLESGAREIVVMTRWNVNDLCGKLLDSDPDNWYLIKMPAMKEDGTMLCEDILDKDTYLKRKNAPGTDPIIFAANYDQNTIEFSDRLYGDFKTYDVVQEHYERIEAYIDTADEGSDFLAGFVVGVHEGICDVLDLIYTQEPMEVTEPAVAKMLTSTDCDRAWIESNNGGRGFARNVERLLRSSGNSKTRIEWFHQNENKMARILSNATSVASSIRFPARWHSAWPQLYSELMFASRTRKMLHDDAEDALTGIVEKVLNGTNKRFIVW